MFDSYISNEQRWLATRKLSGSVASLIKNLSNMQGSTGIDNAQCSMFS